MMLRRRLIPVAALVVAIGASAAGAATAAETGGGSPAGTDSGKKGASCKVELPGQTVKKATAVEGRELPDAVKAKLAKGGVAAAGNPAELQGKGQAEVQGKIQAEVQGKIQDKSQIEIKSGGGKKGPVCKKNPGGISPKQIAGELGVSDAALNQALDQSKQWVAATSPTPDVAQFEQHLADLLHVPVAKVAAVLKPGK